jgi:hypothetical protein
LNVSMRVEEKASSLTIYACKVASAQIANVLAFV